MSTSLIEKEKPPARRGGRTHLKTLKKLVATSPVTERDGALVRLVSLPEPLAVYFITSVTELEAHKDPVTAFALGKARGQPKKEKRNLLIALAITELRSQGMPVGEAIDYAANAVDLSREGVRAAYRKGKNIAGLIQSLVGQRDPDLSRRQQSYLDIIRREYPAPVALGKAKKTHS